MVQVASGRITTINRKATEVTHLHRSTTADWPLSPAVVEPRMYASRLSRTLFSLRQSVAA